MVSIGIPIYNVEKFIERCARSLFGQTYDDIEYIFVDDCSPDRSIDVLNRVLADYPHRKNHVRIIRHEHNQGLAAARNTAVEHAMGDFLMHVDSDDYIDKTLVERCVKKQQETNSDIVLFDFVMLTKKEDVILHHIRCYSAHKRTLALLARQTPVCLWGGFYRLSLYKQNNITAVVGVNNNEDFQVSPRLSYYSRSIAYLDEHLYFYDCTNNDSITQNFNISQAEQGWKSIEILKEFFKDKGEDYMEAIQIATINRLATYIKWSIKAKNRGYYNDMQNKQKEVGMKWVNSVPLSKRVYLYIRSYYLLYLYTRLGVFIKKHIKR